MPATDRAKMQAFAVQHGVPATGTTAAIQDRVTKLGYNAAEDKGRRQAPTKRVKHESQVLTPPKRRRLNATAQEQLRNHSLIAWMIRKHLDYVSRFHVSIRTEDPTLNSLMNRIFKWHGAPRNLDVAGRLGRDEMFRLFELEKVVSGDAGLIKLPELKLQGLESDLIAKGGYSGTEKVNDDGLVVDGLTGKRLKFSVCTRKQNGNPEHHHLEDAAAVIFDGYWSRLTSQYRGVSPLSTALNTVQDISEAMEFNLLKTKMHALFGLAIMRKTDGTAEMGGAGGALAETSDGEETATDSHLDLNPGGVSILDLNPDEDVKILESGSPSTEFVEGSYLFIHLAMLALDIPITCFDSRRSSFSARIADLNEYEVSCDSKRTKNRYVRQEYSDWLLREIWNTPDSPWGLREVAKQAGMGIMDVQQLVEWVPAGSPWLDKLKQVVGDEKAIELRLDNAQDASRRRGADVFKNIDKQLEVEKYENDKRAEMGLPERVAGDPDKYAAAIDAMIAADQEGSGDE